MTDQICPNCNEPLIEKFLFTTRYYECDNCIDMANQPVEHNPDDIDFTLFNEIFGD